MRTVLNCMMLSLFFLTDTHAQSPKPAQQLPVSVQQNIKDFSYQVAKARQTYRDEIKKARDSTVAVLMKQLDEETKKGNLDGALAIRTEIERLQAKDFLSELEKSQDPKQVLSNPAALAQKILIGRWRVKNSGGYEAVWEFQNGGKVLSTSEVSSGKWLFDANKQRILIKWDNTDKWDSFSLPLDPKGTKGETWQGAGVSCFAVKEP